MMKLTTTIILLTILYSCGNSLPENAVMVPSTTFEKKNIDSKKEKTIDKKENVSIDTTQKESVDINISNKKEILVSQRQEVNISIKGKNKCLNSKQVDSIINTLDVNYKTTAEIQSAIITATGSSSCWELISPGLSIEVTEVFEKPEVKKETEKIPLKIKENNPKVTKNTKQKKAPESSKQITTKTVAVLKKINAGKYKTCGEFAKAYGILNIKSFCEMNNYRPETKLKADDYLMVPVSIK